METGRVALENVSLIYRMRFEQVSTLKGRVLHALHERRAKRMERFWALNNVSFAVESGETFGIIGSNGSGKSSLLKLITGVFPPSEGRVAVTGRVTALLELGTGFHPDLNGRENILLNGLVLGMRREELTKRMESIVEFSGLGRFVDTPVRHYSAGMYMRLGFSVAAHADPDVFVIDEVLSVGDEAFQQRCFPKIHEFQRQGKTIVFASHDLAALSALCRRGLWLHRGKVAAIGEMPEVVRQYRAAVETGKGASVES